MASGRFKWQKPIAGLDSLLDEVDEIMLEAVKTKPLGGFAADLIKRGGKRLRPALTLTAASLSGISNSKRAVLPAAAVELVHLASLVHDDALDKSQVRRGAPTASLSLGPNTALLLGDFLLARAFRLASEADKRVAGLLADTVSAMAGGEALGSGERMPLEHMAKEYFDLIISKTASLFEAAATAGALYTGLSAKKIGSVGQFGVDFGVGFQLIDDVQDNEVPGYLKPKVLEEIDQHMRRSESHLEGMKGEAAESLRSLPSAYLDWASPL